MKSVPGELQTIRFGVFELNTDAGELRKQGVKIRLQEQPLRILQMLLGNPGRLVTRDELRNALWPGNSYVDFDQGLNRAINKLREALGDSAEGPRFIETVAKRGYRLITEINSSSGEIRSLAVLPLEDLAQEPGQEFFSEGMTEALITTLGKIGSLRVASRTSAMQYKGVHRRIGEIASELRVEAIVEGTILRTGDRIRISVRLVDARTDTLLWTESYDRDMRDVLSLQADVATAIAREISAKLTHQEQQQLARRHRLDPKAYELYLMGRYCWNRKAADSLKKGAECFQQAIARDPGYAAAYSGLADCANSAGFWGFASPENGCGAAKSLAMKSLEIQESAEAHSSLAWALLQYDYDYLGAEAEFHKSLALYPGYSTACQRYGICLSSMGRLEEGVSMSQHGVQLDPLSQIARVCYVGALWFAREWDTAISQCEDALKMDPNFAQLRWMLANSLQGKGDHDLAIRESRRALELAPGSTMFLAELGRSYAAAGLITEARGVLDQLHCLRESQYVMAYLIAGLYATLGENDEAFRWFEVALQERSSQLAYVMVDPRFDCVRKDPRHQDLVRRLGCQGTHR